MFKPTVLGHSGMFCPDCARTVGGIPDSAGQSSESQLSERVGRPRQSRRVGRPPESPGTLGTGARESWRDLKKGSSPGESGSIGFPALQDSRASARLSLDTRDRV